MTDKSELPRRIGLGGALLLAFNGAIGASIFALPGTLAKDFGTFAPWLFPLVGLASLLIAVPFSRAVGAFPDNGGPATYGRVFGTLAGFELGWIYYIARAAAFAANLNVLITYLAGWWSGADSGASRVALMLSITAGLALANIAGVKGALRLLGGLTLLKTLPLIAIVVAVIVTTDVPAPGQFPQTTAFESGALIVFYAFVGFENATVTAGETHKPGTTLPRALIGTILTIALLYFLVQLAFVTIFPAGTVGTDTPMIALGERVAGSAGATLLGIAAIASLAGNLQGNMTATPRVTFAMAEHGDLPRWLGSVHSRWTTPAASIGFFAVLVAMLAISGSFVWLAIVSTLARMIVYAVTMIALPRAPGRPQHIGVSYWLSAAIGILICALAAAQAEFKAWATLAVLAGAGLVLYGFARRQVRI